MGLKLYKLMENVKRLLHPHEMISLIDFSGLRISNVICMELAISYEKFCCPND